LQVVQLGFQRPGTVNLPEQNIIICNPNEETSKIYVVISIAIEFFVDIFVSVRLFLVLLDANRNSAQLPSNLVNKSKRTVFTAIMYWNFLRLVVAFVFHFTPILNFISNGLYEVRYVTMQCLINIILSYVITVDAEIVRVIKGRENENSISSGTDKSFKNMQIPRTPPHYSSSKSMQSPRVPPQYSSYSFKSHSVPPTYSSHFNETRNQIDDNKVAIVSMKKLSFYEWVNVVVWDRKNDEEHEQYDNDNTEEIVIDAPSEVSREDIEKGSAENHK
jgi:hypothetical protein